MQELAAVFANATFNGRPVTIPFREFLRFNSTGRDVPAARPIGAALYPHERSLNEDKLYGPDRLLIRPELSSFSTTGQAPKPVEANL